MVGVYDFSEQLSEDLGICRLQMPKLAEYFISFAYHT